MKRARLHLFAFAIGSALVAQTQVEPTEHIAAAEAATHLVSSVQPNLPPEAIQKHISGSVCLKTTIAPAGNVAAVQAISGHPLLIPPAIEAVKQWKYDPFIRRGEARTVRTEVCIDFPRNRLTPRANPLSVTLLAMAFGCIGLCGWAWKATLARTGQALRGVRFTIAVVTLVAVSLSALTFVGFGMAWVTHMWMGSGLTSHVSIALWLVSVAAAAGSAAWQHRVVQSVVAAASVLMASAWFIVAVASIPV
jgi:hypothetical protein